MDIQNFLDNNEIFSDLVASQPSCAVYLFELRNGAEYTLLISAEAESDEARAFQFDFRIANVKWCRRVILTRVKMLYEVLNMHDFVVEATYCEKRTFTNDIPQDQIPDITY